MRILHCRCAHSPACAVDRPTVLTPAGLAQIALSKINYRLGEAGAGLIPRKVLIYGQPFSKVGAHPDDPASELMLSTAITPVEKRDDIKAHMHHLGPGFSAYWIRGSGTDAGVHVRLQGARRVAKDKVAKAAKKTSLPGWEGLRTRLPVHCARLSCAHVSPLPACAVEPVGQWIPSRWQPGRHKIDDVTVDDGERRHQPSPACVLSLDTGACAVAQASAPSQSCWRCPSPRPPAARPSSACSSRSPSASRVPPTARWTAST